MNVTKSVSTQVGSVIDWRKRSNSKSEDSDSDFNSVLPKRPRHEGYFFILKSESSTSEDDRSEDYDSVQEKETDYCRDTSDTDTKSIYSDDESKSSFSDNINVEFEIVSELEEEFNPLADSSSAGEEEAMATRILTASILRESEIELTTNEDSDDESSVVSSIVRTRIFEMCCLCKKITRSNNPLCSNCFQAKKNCYPPRPRHKKKLQNTSNIPKTLILPNSSQDSGIYSGNSSAPSTSSSQELDGVESSSSLVKPLHPTAERFLSASQELCVLCNEMPKNGIFVHGSTGHLHCCYHCAIKYWSKSKRCAYCNVKSSNVLKAFLL